MNTPDRKPGVRLVTDHPSSFPLARAGKAARGPVPDPRAPINRLQLIASPKGAIQVLAADDELELERSAWS